MKILYVHGYGGSANGESSQLLKKVLSEKFDNVEIEAPAIPLEEPEKAFDTIRECAKGKDLIIASSLGAFYAMQVPIICKILINPALPENIEKNIDGVSKDFIKELKEIYKEFFDVYIDYEYMYESFFIVGEKDNIAPNKNFLLENFYKDRVFDADMGHKLDENGANKVVEVIEKIRRDKLFCL